MVGEIVIRDRQFNFRLTSAQDAMLRRLAAEDGRALSDFIRRTLIDTLHLPDDRSVSPDIGDGDMATANAEVGNTL